MLSDSLRNSGVSGIQFPIITAFGIRWIGTTYVDQPTTRTANLDDKQECHLHVIYGGQGEVLINGVWVNWPVDTAYVNPRQSEWGWRLSNSGSELEHFYIRYLESDDTSFPTSRSDAFLVEMDDSEDIILTYDRLYRETISFERMVVLRCLTELIAFQGREIILGTKSRTELAHVWAAVMAEPAKNWTVSELSRIADLSMETLRLHCQREVSRSPVRQVTFLRMRKAAGLLESTDMSLQQIARTVGYESSFNFSTAFKRLFRTSPSEYRRKAWEDRAR